MKWKSTATIPGPPGYPERLGEEVEILRLLTAEEADLEETGPMYRVRFADGTETDAFHEELVNPLVALTTTQGTALREAIEQLHLNGWTPEDWEPGENVDLDALAQEAILQAADMVGLPFPVSEERREE